MKPLLTGAAFYTVAACSGGGPVDDAPAEWQPHGPVADDIYAPMGQPLPSATAAQLATFERGLAVVQRRFTLEDGLGPAYNVTFCGACHEKPTFGGSAGLYRNFFIGARETSDGAFFFANSAANPSGVIRMYYYGTDIDPDEGSPVALFDSRPEVPQTTNIVAQRNPIPFFGVGLLAELTNDELLKRADPDDLDGDGISGRPNFDRGFVGRFGMKSQTVSIEGFIRGPLFNHLGITSEQLSNERRAELPVDSSDGNVGLVAPALKQLRRFLQSDPGSGPTLDNDAVPDPELHPDDLFDVVSYSMLLAAPEPEPLNEERLRGMEAFDQVGCAGCHTPRLQGPRGPIPVYSDLLVHDMGPELADGLIFLDASGSEFRSMPLWGIAAVGPYLHDGRADTIDEAIRMHGGEAERSRDRYAELSEEERAALVEFLLSLGGRSQASDGLIPPDTPIATTGSYGGPLRDLSAADEERFLAGRDAFDREFGYEDGVGFPRFNGDSCRACHFEPVVGGAGPRGVNVMRHGIVTPEGDFVLPAVGSILHKQTILPGHANAPQSDATIFEHRQTPHLFGLGVIQDIPEAAILANADPDDADGDGISGKPSYTDGNRLGRFGWKGQVPSVEEFVRDAVFAELGMTLPAQEGLTFGRIHDNDEIPDPEFTLAEADALAFYLKTLAPPPRSPAPDQALADLGEVVFSDVGCASCHVTSLAGVPVYSDLLLHEILPPDMLGVEEASATMRELRTPPLWGVSQTAPYLHDGSTDTLLGAVEAHDGEAAGVRDAFGLLDQADRAALIAFLETL